MSNRVIWAEPHCFSVRASHCRLRYLHVTGNHKQTRYEAAITQSDLPSQQLRWQPSNPPPRYLACSAPSAHSTTTITTNNNAEPSYPTPSPPFQTRLLRPSASPRLGLCPTRPPQSTPSSPTYPTTRPSSLTANTALLQNGRYPTHGTDGAGHQKGC